MLKVNKVSNFLRLIAFSGLIALLSVFMVTRVQAEAELTAEIKDLIKDSNDNLYVATANGVWRYEKGNWVSASEGLKESLVYSLAKDEDGNLYASTDSEIYEYENNTWVPLNEPNKNGAKKLTVDTAKEVLYALPVSAPFELTAYHYKENDNDKKWTSHPLPTSPTNLNDLVVKNSYVYFSSTLSRSGYNPERQIWSYDPVKESVKLFNDRVNNNLIQLVANDVGLYANDSSDCTWFYPWNANDPQVSLASPASLSATLRMDSIAIGDDKILYGLADKNLYKWSAGQWQLVDTFNSVWSASRLWYFPALTPERPSEYYAKYTLTGIELYQPGPTPRFHDLSKTRQPPGMRPRPRLADCRLL